jgi:hypothetical protein
VQNGVYYSGIRIFNDRPHYIRNLLNDTVTCQPFVGLRNGVSRHRPVKKVPRRRGDVTQQRWNTAPARDRDVTRQHARFQGNAGKRGDVTAHLASCSETDQATGNSAARTIEGLYEEMKCLSRQFLGSSSTREILRSNPTSEVSIGYRHGKCEDAKCVII